MANLNPSDGFTDLVRDSRLQATFRSDGQQSCTIHTRSAGHRTRQRRDIWIHKKELGFGGYGSVQLQLKEAPNPGLPQYRAVKSIRVSENDFKSKRSQYVRELESLAKFSHEKYTDFFVKFSGWYTSPGWLHIAMEYCELGDLHKYLSDARKCPDNRLPEDQVLDIASQVLNALSMMHGERFAHRDLKPANILIKSHPPEPWWVKMCDLGLSKRIGDFSGSTMVPGTRNFMPPEILGFIGDSKAADPYLGDMWSFGETIFQTLTGQPTFDNPTSINRYCNNQIQFPGAALRDLGASEDAIGFIGSVMNSNPSKRLTADEALGHCWIKLNTQTPPEEGDVRLPNASDESSQWSLEVPFRPQMNHDMLATAEWTTTGNHYDSPSITRNTAQIQVVHQSSSQSLSTKGTRDDAKMPTVEDETPIAREGRDTLPNNEGNTIQNHAEDVTLRPQFLPSTTGEPTGKTEAIREDPVSIKDFENIRDIRSRAETYYREKQYHSAEQMFRKVLEHDIRELGRDHLDTIETMERVSSCLEKQRKREEREEILRELLHINEQVSGRNHSRTCNSLYKLALSVYDQERYREAEELFEKTLSLCEEVSGRKHPDILDIQYWLAQSVFRQKRYQEAEEVFRKNLSLRQKVLGREHPNTLLTLYWLAQSVFEQKRYQEAEEVFRKNLSLKEKILGGEHPDILNIQFWVARSVFEQKRYKEAEEVFRKNLSLREKVLGREHPDTVSTQYWLAQVVFEQKRYQEAEKVFRKNLSLREKVSDREHPDTLDTQYWLAQVVFRQKRYHEAEEAFRKNLSLRKKVLGGEHPDTLDTQYWLNKLLSKNGEKGKKSGPVRILKEIFGSSSK
ncbi:kinase-like domain-containing protein [Ilyonectria robusta]|uniref:kinase-like domain-containing protein n=1 Tax=Ilyonectria robusta TaxID=1079257 RepID=UPI001E8ED9CB|nr:kinase-like domain-containing protein [Ilyonectria robusta]KAH8722144.1 kinase-like domain-containing protein [Ilyonectria robusta]